MARQFDLVVIGTGAAGSAVAYRCRRAGWTVAIIDSRPFGGTCALRGCDPKKVLVGGAEAIDWTRRLSDRGIRADGVALDWPALVRFKRSIIERVPADRTKGFAEAGIEAFHGRARFVGPTSVQVGDAILEGRHVHIAAGARPADLPVPGCEQLVTSEQFLELDELPRRIVFVGGGYISFEFAHVAVRAGAHVTILHRGSRPLGLFDPDLVDLLVARTRSLGVDVQLETEVTAVEKAEGGLNAEHIVMRGLVFGDPAGRSSSRHFTPHNGARRQRGDQLVGGFETPGAQFGRHHRLQRFQFHRRIRARVDFRGLHVRVSEPQRDLSQIFGRLQNGQGTRVSQHVRRYALRRQRRALLLRGPNVFVQKVFDA